MNATTIGSRRARLLARRLTRKKIHMRTSTPPATRLRRRAAGSLAVAVLGASLALAAPMTASASAGAHYVNCSLATNGSGSQASPWNSLASAAAHTYGAGDSLLLARGTTCTGSLLIQSSGASGNPITIDAYGTGALPVINAAGLQYALKLNNASYVTVQNLELKNSTRYGLFATSSVTGVVNGLTVRGLLVHDVNGGVMDEKQTGLVVIIPGIKGSKFNTVLVENVTAYGTNLWSGIMVYGVYLTGDFSWKRTSQNVSLRSTNVTLRNNVVHDTWGDGIVTYLVSGALLESNTVYRSGIQPTQTIGTPNAIWSWASNNVVVQYNEAYENSSPGVDGGAFDVDFFSANTTVQYNYAHDNKGYCVAVFGAEKSTTTNSIVRYNICANNGTKGTGTEGSEEIYFATWNLGKIDGVQVYGNTIYTTKSGAVGVGPWANPVFSGSLPEIFQNNLVVSTVANVYGTGMPIVPWTTRSNNLYYYTTGSFSGTEVGSIYNTNPLVNNLGYNDNGRPTTQWTLQAGSPARNAGATIAAAGNVDFYGNAVPTGSAFDIGAHEAG